MPLLFVKDVEYSSTLNIIHNQNQKFDMQNDEIDFLDNDTRNTIEFKSNFPENTTYLINLKQSSGIGNQTIMDGKRTIFPAIYPSAITDATVPGW